MNADDLETFIGAYVDCALWATSIGDSYAAQWREETGEEIAGDTSMESFGFSRDDLAPETEEIIRADCASFVAICALDLAEGWTAEQAGHDFLLTRDCHGAGFWDRYYSGSLTDAGRRLTDVAHAYGDAELYVGDDGRIYV